MNTAHISLVRARGLTSGLVLVALGCVFLAKSFGVNLPENWWAAFLLFPALPILFRIRSELARGRTDEALRSLISVLILVVLSAALAFDLNWSRVWPVMVILVGVSVLLPKRSRF